MVGGLRAVVGERKTTRFRTRKAASLLAYVAYHLDQRHEREILGDLLWLDSPPDSTETNLYAELSSVSKQLEPPAMVRGTVIQADLTATGLNSAAVTTDVAVLDKGLAPTAWAPGEAERTERLLAAPPGERR